MGAKISGKEVEGQKNELKSENYEIYRNMEELLNNRPEHIPGDQWIVLIGPWNLEKVKVHSFGISLI